MEISNIPLRGAWLEIDLPALKHNLQTIRSLISQDTILMPVVKADAYGHGGVGCAAALIEAGAERFAVATLEEGIHLREAGVTLPIHCLGYLPSRQYQYAIDNDFILTIYDLEQAKEISALAAKAQKTITIHIKIDSGFTRLGFMPNTATIDDICQIVNLPYINAEGIFSHFSSADFADKTTSHQQNAVFEHFLMLLQQKNISFPIRHMANSAAIIDMPEYNYELCRPGIILYGYTPSAAVKHHVDLKPVMSLKAEIARIMEIPPGTAVSYGCEWHAKEKSLIATIPLGYADGYSRLLGNKGQVIVNGQLAPIVGRICMDHFMVDVTHIKSTSPLKKGDLVTVMGSVGDVSITADSIAALTSTINYEVLCLLGTRLPKVYLDK